MWLDARVGKQNYWNLKLYFLECVVKGCDERVREIERGMEKKSNHPLWTIFFFSRHSMKFIFYDYQMKSWNMSISICNWSILKICSGNWFGALFSAWSYQKRQRRKKPDERAKIQWFVATIIIFTDMTNQY